MHTRNSMLRARLLRDGGAGTDPATGGTTGGGGTPETPPTITPQPTLPAVPATGEPLGEPGKAALDAERKARREAEKNLKELRDRLQSIEDKDKTDLEKATAKLAELAEQHTQERTARLRLEAAAEHGIPKEYHDLLTATDEEALKAQAEKVAALVKGTNGAPTPLPGQGTPPKPPAATVQSGAALYAQRHATTTS